MGSRLWLSWLAPLSALALAAPAPVLAAAAPPALLSVERALDDHPQQLLENAEVALQAASAGSDAAWQARVRQIAAASMLDRIALVAALLPDALAEAGRRRDAGPRCLLEGVKILSDRETVGAAEAGAGAAAALARAQAAGEDWCVARLRLVRGRMLAGDGRIAESMAELQLAIGHFESAGETALLAQALSDLGWAFRRDRDNPESIARALEAARGAVDRLDAGRQRFLASNLHHNLAGVYLSAGQLTLAREHASLAMRHAQQLGDTVGVAFIDRLIGRLDLDQRRPAAALEHFVRAVQVFEGAGLADMQLVAVTGRAEALLALGRPAEAGRQIAEARALSARVAKPELDVEFQRVAMEVGAAQRDAPATAAAARAYAQALRDSERDQNRRSAAELHERFRSERAEAENRLLREQQQAADSRQRWLLATLALAAVLLAGLATHVVQQRRLRQRLKTLAEVDDLTGLPNRRSILETARRIAAGQRATDRPACLAVIDIDHFKRVNDQHGHEVGDAALVAFAQACRQALRQHDAVGRMGGEEFLMVLPATRPEDAALAFGRLRAALRATVVPGLPVGQRLSCSMGFAELLPGQSVKEALCRADEALYRAKAEGRDRLALAA